MQRTIQFKIGLFVASILTPFALLISSLLYSVYTTNLDFIRYKHQGAAELLKMEVEQQLHGYIEALELFAIAFSVRNKSWKTLEPRLEEFLRDFPDDANFVIVDGSFRQVYNYKHQQDVYPSVNKMGAEHLEKVRRTHKPQISDIRYGPLVGRYIYTVTVFARADDGDELFITLYPGSVFKNMFEEFAKKYSKVVGLFDGNGLSIVRQPSVPMGTIAPGQIVAAKWAAPIGYLEAHSIENEEIVAAYHKLDLTDWFVVVANNRARLLWPLQKSIAIWVTLCFVTIYLIGCFVLYCSTSMLRDYRRQEYLTRELNHRVKNILSIIQSIIFFSLRKERSEAVEIVTNRVNAVAKVHDLLSTVEWKGADMVLLVNEILQPYHPEQFGCTGPHIKLNAKASMTVALILNELATNALKYGSLSVPEGKVRLMWGIEKLDHTFIMVWQEHDGPTVVPPSRRGFGTTVVARTIQEDLQGSISIDYRPEGLFALIKIPQRNIK